MSSLIASAERAVKAANDALPYTSFAAPLVRREPGGTVAIDVPLMYNGFALDRVHFDPLLMCPSPKGRPVRVREVTVSLAAVKRVMDEVKREIRVVGAAEYREPEGAWAVPLSWRSLLIAHIKVRDGVWDIVPDLPLTEELRRRIL